MYKTFGYAAIGFGILVLAGCGKRYISGKKDPVKVGGKAPDFALKDETGTTQRLTDYRGKKVVLYFYPKDFTPGCTAEACSLRDNYAAYRENNIAILGVSYDSVASHQKFKEEHHIPFPLLSDTTRSTARAYGAYKSFKNMLYPDRMTFLIDENGVIIHIFYDVDVAQHAEEILKTFKLHTEK